MKDRLSFSDRTSFSRVSQRLSTACMSDGITGVELLSFASAILNHKNVMEHHILYDNYNSLVKTILLKEEKTITYLRERSTLRFFVGSPLSAAELTN